MSKPSDSANYGIVGNVSAKAVAVGTGASAQVTENAPASRAEFDAALSALREQIAAIQLPQPSREVLAEDLKKIEQMAGEKPEHKPGASDLLKGFADKLKMVGVLLQSAAGLQEPIKKLAAWFHIPLPF